MSEPTEETKVEPQQQQQPQQTGGITIVSQNDPDSHDKDSPSSPLGDTPKKAGRRKINIEFIEDKSRRHITFSKRKAGIMKKAYELSTLTGTQVLLLVASETGHVYTFATPKLQPLITKPEGKNLIQACLNAPDVGSQNQSPAPQQPTSQRMSHNTGYQEPILYHGGSPTDALPPQSHFSDEDKKEPKEYPSSLPIDMGSFPGQYGSPNLISPVRMYPPSLSAVNVPQRSPYMSPAGQYPYPQQQQYTPTYSQPAAYPAIPNWAPGSKPQTLLTGLPNPQGNQSISNMLPTVPKS